MAKNIQELFPFPGNGEMVEETPPTFCFAKEEGKSQYTVLVRKKQGELVFQGTTKKNYVIPGDILSPGEYQWNLIRDKEERGWWDFTVSDRAVPFIRPSAGDEVGGQAVLGRQLIKATPWLTERHGYDPTYCV